MRNDTAPAPLPTGPRGKKRHRPLNKGGRWLLILFALPFALVGWALLLLNVVPTVVDWTRMQSWQATPATLSAAELHVNRSSKSRSYRVTATYHYRVDGRDFTGQRVTLSTAADNVGDFQEALGARLTGALQAGTAVTAWVNPSDPQQAVLDRSLRPGLLALKLFAALLFGGFGTVMAIAAWRAGRRAAAAEAVAGAETLSRDQSSPTSSLSVGAQPWLHNPDWADNRIASTQRHLHWGAWFAAVCVNALAMPVVWMQLPRAIRQANYPVIAVTALFFLAGLAMLIWALRLSASARRFGDVRLELDPFPGAIGGHVGGTLELPVAARHSTRFAAELECVRRERTRHKDETRTHDHQLWQREGMAQVLPLPSGLRVSLRFDVPQGLHPSTVKTAQAGRAAPIVWRLTVRSTDPDLRFERSFEIPVFDTGARSAHLKHDAAQHSDQRAYEDRELQRICRIEQQAGEVRLHFPAGRRWQSGLNWMLLGAAFAGTGLGAHALGAPVLFPVLFGLFGAPLCVGGLYMLTNSLRVRVTPAGFYTERRWLGLLVGREELRRKDLRQLQLKQSYSSASASRRITWYRVEALRKDGRRVTLADSLRNQGLAQHLLERLQQWPDR